MGGIARWAMVWAVGCGTRSVHDPSDLGADADVDVDVDADADADTDADADPGGPLATATWSQTLDGVALCDVTVELTGEDYVGRCPGCTFAFKVEGAVTSIDGPFCSLPESLTFRPDAAEYWSAQYLAYAPHYSAILPTATGTVTVDYDHALLSGYLLDATSYGGGIYGPYFAAVYSSNHGVRGPDLTESASQTYADGTLDLSFVRSYDYGQEYAGTTLGSACYGLDGDPQFDPHPLVVGTQALQEDVDCRATTADVVSMTLTAGDVVQFSVDTPDPLGAFDPTVWVRAPGCLLTSPLSTPFDENVRCTNPTLGGYWCPAGQFTAPESGTYELVIDAYPAPPQSACDPLAKVGIYDLQVDAPGAPPLTLRDDVPFWNRTSHVEESYGLTVTPANGGGRR